MKKSTSLLMIIFVIGFLYFFIQNGIDQLFSKFTFIFFSGVYFIVKQLEENNKKKKSVKKLRCGINFVNLCLWEDRVNII